MGGPAWQFKKFADASSKPWFTQNWKDKIAGGFTTSATVNGDKFSTIQYFITLSQQHGQIWCGVGLMAPNTKADGPEKMNWTGGYSGLLCIDISDPKDPVVRASINNLGNVGFVTAQSD